MDGLGQDDNECVCTNENANCRMDWCGDYPLGCYANFEKALPRALHLILACGGVPGFPANLYPGVLTPETLDQISVVPPVVYNGFQLSSQVRDKFRRNKRKKERTTCDYSGGKYALGSWFDHQTKPTYL